MAAATATAITFTDRRLCYLPERPARLPGPLQLSAVFATTDAYSKLQLR